MQVRRLFQFPALVHVAAHIAPDTCVRQAVPQDLLKKYILYSRSHCHPKLHNIDEDKVRPTLSPPTAVRRRPSLEPNNLRRSPSCTATCAVNPWPAEVPDARDANPPAPGYGPLVLFSTGIPIAIRHIESIIRMSEAHGKPPTSTCFVTHA